MRAIVLLVSFLLFAAPALAHKVIVFAYMEGSELVAEGSFPGGRACKECPMRLVDAASGETLLEASSDEGGIWRTPLPPEAEQANGGLLVVLDGGEGHRAEWRLEPDEYMRGAPSSPQKAETPAPAPAEQSAPAPLQPAPFDAAELERVVSEAVSKEIAPLKRQLLQAEQPSLRDALGGIGYLVGLAGLFAWARSRKPRQ